MNYQCIYIRHSVVRVLFNIWILNQPNTNFLYELQLWISLTRELPSKIMSPICICTSIMSSVFWKLLITAVPTIAKGLTSNCSMKQSTRIWCKPDWGSETEDEINLLESPNAFYFTNIRILSFIGTVVLTWKQRIFFLLPFKPSASLILDDTSEISAE